MSGLFTVNAASYLFITELRYSVTIVGVLDPLKPNNLPGDGRKVRNYKKHSKFQDKSHQTRDMPAQTVTHILDLLENLFDESCAIEYLTSFRILPSLF